MHTSVDDFKSYIETPTEYDHYNYQIYEAQTIIDQYIRQVDRLKPVNGQYATKKRNRKRSIASSVLTIAAAAVFILLVFSVISHNI